MKRGKQGRKILTREVINDQSDPRIVEFRKSCGEFEPGCKRETVKLEITEYDTSPDKIRLTTKFGYYEGDRPPIYRKFFQKLRQETLNEAMKNKGKRASDRDTSE
jgi:hypothetical protein